VRFNCVGLGLVYIEVTFLILIGLKRFHADRQRGTAKQI